MSDNIDITPGSGRKVATDQVTYSGDTADVQLVRLVGTTGAEGSKTVIADPYIGDLTETAPASDTASSGLNGRLQRIAQRLTSLIALIPTSLGQKTKANSLAVTLASDQGEVGKVYQGYFAVQGGTLTRPANTTAYGANDSISDNATAASVTPNSVALSDTNDVAVEITEVLLDATDTGPGTSGIQLRIHFFSSDPTANSGVINGDNGAWSNKKAGWMGSCSGVMRLFNDGSRGVLVPDEGGTRLAIPATGTKNIYWQLQALGGFTPSANSTVFQPTFKGFQARLA